jgi:hypothetical protein
MAFATGIFIQRVMNELPEEFLVGRRMGGMTFRAITSVDRIIRMSLQTLRIFRVVTLFTEFFGGLKKFIRLVACMGVMALEAVLGCGLVDFCPLESLLLMAGETKLIALNFDQFR